MLFRSRRLAARQRAVEKGELEAVKRLTEMQIWRPSGGVVGTPKAAVISSEVVGVQGLHIVDASVLVDVDGMPNARIARHAVQQAQFLTATAGRDETGRTA